MRPRCAPLQSKSLPRLHPEASPPPRRAGQGRAGQDRGERPEEDGAAAAGVERGVGRPQVHLRRAARPAGPRSLPRCRFRVAMEIARRSAAAGVVIQMYFVGNALSIFTLMAVYYNLQAPLLGLWTIKKRFYDVYRRGWGGRKARVLGDRRHATRETAALFAVSRASTGRSRWPYLRQCNSPSSRW